MVLALPGADFLPSVETCDHHQIKTFFSETLLRKTKELKPEKAEVIDSGGPRPSSSQPEDLKDDEVRSYGSSGTELDTSSEFVDAESDFGNNTFASEESAFESFNTAFALDLSPRIDPPPDSFGTPVIAARVLEEESSDVETPKAEEQPLPIAKGSYNIDWDNFDESAFDPFKASPKVRKELPVFNMTTTVAEDLNANEHTKRREVDSNVMEKENIMAVK